MITSETDLLKRDRVLIIGNEPTLSEMLGSHHPEWEVVRAANILEGIDDLSRSSVRAVIAFIDEEDPRLRDALAGLREAAGERTRVLLCCPPEFEPHVRRSTDAGADDYFLYPPDQGELDKALGCAPTDAGTPAVFTNGPAASMEELRLLSDILANLSDDPYTVLTRIADLLRCALGAQTTTLVVEGSAISSGGSVIEPVLLEPIPRGGTVVGQITVGPRSTPYRAADLEKLRHYAALTGHLLAAADAQQTWRKRAFTDEVSGLYNRRYVLEFLEKLLERARDERFRVTVLLFDIDNFKSYNDTYGHSAGDEVIRCIGELFQSHCREHDLVTRYGGDEFCVVFWDADQPRVAGSQHPSDAIAVLTRFKEALKTYHCTPLEAEARGRLTISGGLASFPWDGNTALELIDRADAALLRAKQAGKNQVFVFGDGASLPEC